MRLLWIIKLPRSCRSLREILDFLFKLLLRIRRYFCWQWFNNLKVFYNFLVHNFTLKLLLFILWSWLFQNLLLKFNLISIIESFFSRWLGILHFLNLLQWQLRWLIFLRDLSYSSLRIRISDISFLKDHNLRTLLLGFFNDDIFLVGSISFLHFGVDPKILLLLSLVWSICVTIVVINLYLLHVVYILSRVFLRAYNLRPLLTLSCLIWFVIWSFSPVRIYSFV